MFRPLYTAYPGPAFSDTLPYAGTFLVYFSGLGYLLWSISQFASVRVASTQSARLLSAGIWFAIIGVIPLVLGAQALLVPGSTTGAAGVLQYLALTYPLTANHSFPVLLRGEDMVWSGAIAYTLGQLFWTLSKPKARKVTAGADLQ
jgi:hypothetical protein